MAPPNSVRDAVAVHNERMKLAASSINALGLALLALGALQPLVVNGAAPSPVWTLVGLALHGVSHYVLRSLRKAG
jgi:hypothetical protein